MSEEEDREAPLPTTTEAEPAETAEKAEDDEAAPGEEKPAASSDAPKPTGAAGVSAANWVYLDKQGAEQGPFPTEQMKQWFAAGYLDPTLKVKHTFARTNAKRRARTGKHAHAG